MRLFLCPWSFPLPWPSQSPSFLLLSLCPQLFNFFAGFASWDYTLNVEVPWGHSHRLSFVIRGWCHPLPWLQVPSLHPRLPILTSRLDLFLRLQPVFPTASWTSPLECPILSSLPFHFKPISHQVLTYESPFSQSPLCYYPSQGHRHLSSGILWQSLNLPLVSPLNYFPHSSENFSIVALSLYT